MQKNYNIQSAGDTGLPARNSNVNLVLVALHSGRDTVLNIEPPILDRLSLALCGAPHKWNLTGLKDDG
jgi:hypothetical protein